MIFKTYQPVSLYKIEKLTLVSKSVNTNISGGGRGLIPDYYHFLDLKFKNKEYVYGIYLDNRNYNILNFSEIGIGTDYKVTFDRFLIPRFDSRNMGIVKMEKNGVVIFEENLFENVYRAKIMVCIALFFTAFFVWMHFLLKKVLKEKDSWCCLF